MGRVARSDNGGTHGDSPAERVFAEFLAGTSTNRQAAFEAFCSHHQEFSVELRELYQQYQLFHSGALQLAECMDDEPASDLQGGFQNLILRLQQHLHAYSRYEHRGEIARGGMGTILRVHDDELNRDLAMKVVLTQEDTGGTGETPRVDTQTLARFLDEAQITGQLVHPGIVPVHELGIDAQGRLYFTMQLVKGRTLSEVFELAREGTEGWNRTRVLGVILRACEAVAYAHAEGVVHRDLKPSNIMVGRFGEVYVMDWGLAKVQRRKETRDIRVKEEESADGQQLQTIRQAEAEGTLDSPILTRDGTVLGTPAYMSPEQANGQTQDIDAHSDVYSMGAILYHLLTGRMPYTAEGKPSSAHTVLDRVKAGPPKAIDAQLERSIPQRLQGVRKLKLRNCLGALRDPVEQIPVELKSICEKAMSRHVEDRYPDMGELSEDLRAYNEGGAVKAYEQCSLGERLQRRFTWVFRAYLMTVDIGVLLFACVLGHWFGSGVEGNASTIGLNLAHPAWLVVCSTCILSFALLGLYRPRKGLFGWRDFRAVLWATVATGLVYWLVSYFQVVELRYPDMTGTIGNPPSFRGLEPTSSETVLPPLGPSSPQTVLISFGLFLVFATQWRVVASTLVRRRTPRW